ncbi:MAG: hypothetical protein H6Q25_580 [Bacteroidetes bacterium]|nr:hypothetical protein [Bacteroidota bacterium]
MKRLLFLLNVIFIVFQSCMQSVDIKGLNFLNSDLTINYLMKSSSELDSISTRIISKDSKEFKKFYDWLAKNSKGWENSYTSFAKPPISLTNNDFRLLVFKNFVVIGYTDKNQNSVQLTKKTTINEFEFLNK